VAVLNRPLDRRQRSAPVSLHLGPVLLVAAAAIAIVSLLRVVQTSDATTSSFAIQRLEQEKLEVEAGVGQLEAEVASLASLSRIEQEAKRLGLKPPESREVVQVNVAWPAEEDRLPTRFALDERAEPAEQGSSWWRDLLEFLPFY
jgi:cell division protein FtsL